MHIVREHQHIVNMLRERDHNSSYRTISPHYWASTSFSLAATLYPIPRVHTFWLAARRALILNDLLGHARNILKTYPRTNLPDPPPLPICHLCGLLDSQQHSMLQCLFPPLTIIRDTAKREQHVIAHARRRTLPPHLRVVVDNFIYGCWSLSTQNLRRLWLGLWSPDTVSSLFPPNHNLLTPVSPGEITQFLDTMADLTAPLLRAYSLILEKVIGHSTHLVRHRPSATTTMHQLTMAHVHHPADTRPGLHNILIVDADLFHVSNLSYAAPVSHPREPA